ncbi:flavodoxin family protein [Vallitalea okinawensis]|uniref:flavodoxin family protein n=1 Tax=Vallitalea okinawensis TaxID=2078660 RepID=UPI0013003B29|nr:NAD(P)H-dependent oxidoreductase [Vallitalea okinawensis]
MKNLNPLGTWLSNFFCKKNEEYAYFRLEDMHISPCRSCGACGHKTPGRCVIEDDMPEILRGYATCDVVIMLTPITFGGYSSLLKKAVDKLALTALPLYMVKNGHLLHPSRYGSKTLIVIGVVEKEIPAQVGCFKTLVENNALNMLSSAKALIYRSLEDLKVIETEVANALMEVI